MTADMMAKILDIHNTFRQQQANGQTPNYPPANRMATVVSDFCPSPCMYFQHDTNSNAFSLLTSRDGTAN